MQRDAAPRITERQRAGRKAGKADEHGGRTALTRGEADERHAPIAVLLHLKPLAGAAGLQRKERQDA